MNFRLLWKLKLIYSEKATKFCKISTTDLSYVVPVKSKVEILQNFMVFSEYMNFIWKIWNHTSFFHVFIKKPTPKLLSLHCYQTWHIESTTTAQQRQSCWNIAYEFSIKWHYWKMCEDLTSTPSGFAVWRSPMPWTTDAWCLD